MTSDSSEDENLELLRESIDSKFLNESMFKDRPSASVIDELETVTKPLPPSLRKTQDADEQFNLFRVTPEFQSYIAKNLAKVIEEDLQKCLIAKIKKPERPRKTHRKSGVKLFSNSEKFLKITKNPVNDTGVQTFKQRRVTKVQKNSPVSLEEIAKLAVNPEDIISGKETKFWSNRSKAPVYRYKKSTTDNILTLIEPTFMS
ncbi:hypothetical protein ABEB36_007691 [Hypothenemus hampei]|uniref:Protein CUSTOS n=1 Tax=Hypothenemus hampei TaxID=57062 RepID=A0ABD1EYR6_HYPHA